MQIAYADIALPVQLCITFVIDMHLCGKQVRKIYQLCCKSDEALGVNALQMSTH